MADKREKNKDIDRSVLPRMYGALSGIASAETGSMEYMREPLIDMYNIGNEPYVGESLLKSLESVDPELFAKKLKYEKHLGVPPRLAVTGKTSFTLPEHVKDLVRNHPMIFGKEDLEAVEKIPSVISLGHSSPATLAHEVGHNIKSPISSLNTLLQARHGVAKKISTGTGLAMALSDNDTVSKYAPLISAAPYIPELLEEARASAHGMRAIRAVDGNMAAMKSISTLLPAFMTYAISAIPAIAAPMIARAVKEYAENNREKTASKRAIGNKVKSARESWVTSPPKPKTSKIGKPGTSTSSPPSKRKFYRDMLGELNGLGTRKA